MDKLLDILNNEAGLFQFEMASHGNTQDCPCKLLRDGKATCLVVPVPGNLSAGIKSVLSRRKKQNDKNKSAS